MVTDINYYRLREMVSRCQWIFAKSMPFAPHEYIVKDKCPLSEEEFEYFVTIQRQYGIKERWGKYNTPYLYIDDYKYWTMGAPLAETTVINRAKVKVLGDVLKLHDEIDKIKQAVEEQQPNQVNSIQDLMPDEPKISSILAGLFRQKNNGSYQVFSSFINYCFKGSFPYEIEKPFIQAEVEVKDSKRIDILAYEKGKYAIVVENKIWNAVEQPNQLTNYIKGMREPKYGFTDEQIYIVYLPSTDEHSPTHISWNKLYQQSYASRYKSISFKEGILEWLGLDELDNIDDECFAHSRFLFVDYLKKVFNLTETDNMEKLKIEEYIREVLELKDNDNGYNVAKLTAKCNEIRDCMNQLERMRREYGYQIVKDICSRLENDYSDYTILKDFKPGQYIFTGISIPYKDIKDAICIKIGFEDKNFIYGTTYATNYRGIRNEMQEWDIISRFYLNGDFKKGVDWLFFKGLPFENAYDNFKQLVEALIHI